MFRHSVLLTVFIFSVVIASADILDQPHVAVYGTAEVKVAPNEMNWKLVVRNEDKELSATAQRHTEIVSKIISFLKSLNIDKDKLQTSQMRFGENWDNNSYSKQRKTGYFASTDISFIISDLGLYEKLWFGLSQIEAVSIQNVQYGHNERIRLQNETRQKALLAAKDKAAALANTLGSQLGEVLKIEESAPENFPVPFGKAGANVMYGEGSWSPAQILEPGQITISTQVYAVFKLIK